MICLPYISSPLIPAGALPRCGVIYFGQEAVEICAFPCAGSFTATPEGKYCPVFDRESAGAKSAESIRLRDGAEHENVMVI